MISEDIFLVMNRYWQSTINRKSMKCKQTKSFLDRASSVLLLSARSAHLEMDGAYKLKGIFAPCMTMRDEKILVSVFEI